MERRWCQFTTLVLVVSWLCKYVSSQSTYIADPLLTYTWGKTVPQSCVCEETGATPATCKYFQCKCTCDIQAAVCDYGCCCDPDCTTEQVDRFRLFGCQFEGASTNIQYCYSSDQLSKVNPRDPLGGQTAAQTALGEALCVQKINYAVEGQYFSDIDLKTSAIFNDPVGQKTFDYSKEKINSYIPDAYYDKNDLIEVFYNSSLAPNTMQIVGAGVLLVPVPDDNYNCMDGYARFEVNQLHDETSKCIRDVSNNLATFTSMCSSTISSAYLATSLRVAMHSNTFESTQGVSSAIIADSVGITVQSVVYRDITKGVDYDITALWTANMCGTTLYSTNVAYTSSTCKPTGLPTYPSAATVCAGAVIETAYTVTHSTDVYSSIQGVSVNLVVADIGIPASSVASITTKSTIQFIGSSSAAVSQTNGNLVKRVKSGNPGYLPDSAVLYGQLNSTVISEDIKGFSAPSALNQNSFISSQNAAPDSCPSDGNAISRGSVAVSFGRDISTGCALSLSRSDLVKLCCTGQSSDCNTLFSSPTSPYADTAGLPFFLAASAGYIGIYGNADPLDPSQWIAVTPSSTTGFVRKWNDQTGTCRGMVSAVHYRFLVAYSGEQSNPQNKIVAASIDYSSSDWTINLSPDDATSTQKFAVTSTVSFVFKDSQETTEYYPPPPPVLFKVPYDVFYPFINDAPSSNYYSSVGITVLTVLSVFVILIIQS